MSLRWRYIFLHFLAVVLILTLSAIALANDLPEPPTTKLDTQAQTIMVTAAAGVFLVLPVGVWIFRHQTRRKNRQSQKKSEDQGE